MNKNASVRLSEEEILMLEAIKKVYKTQNTSQILKKLIHKEAAQIEFYTMKNKVSDKYQFNLQSKKYVEQIKKRRGA